MSEINWKLKYEQLKLKFMNSMDMAYRIGFEEGAKDAQMQQMAEQQAAAEQQAQAEANGFGGDGDGEGGEEGGQPGQDGEDPNAQNDGEGQEPGADQPMPGMEEEDPDAPPVEGSELDSHIGQLEQMMMGKTEVSVEDLKKSLVAIKAFKQANDLHKSMKAIKQIGKSFNKKKPAKKSLTIPVKVKFEIGKQASSNLNKNAQEALSVQERIVSDVMKSWDEQEKKASNKIAALASIESLTKKE